MQLNNLKKNIFIPFLLILLVYTPHITYFNSYMNINHQTEELVNMKNEVVIDPLLRTEMINNSDHFENNEIFVKFNEEPSSNHILYLEDNFHLKTKHNFLSYQTILFSTEDTVNINELSKHPQIESIWSNRKVSVNYDYINQKVAYSDTELLNLPFINFNSEIRANKLHEKGINGSSVTIALLDTGVDITGQIPINGTGGGDLDDFDDNASTNDYKFFGAVSLAPDDGFYYSDLHGRGTWAASLACGTGHWNKTFAGVAPGAKYLSVKVFDSFGFALYSSIMSGIDWSVKNSADIVLISAETIGFPGDPLDLAISDAVERGIIVVTPSGNQGSSYLSIESPGYALKAITVGAYDSITGRVADFSSRGPSFDVRAPIDLIAPGVGLIGTQANIIPGGLGDTGEIFSGTAFGVEIAENYTRASGSGAAAAVVAGACALLLEKFPQASPEVIRIALAKTASKLSDTDFNEQGYGLLDVEAAYDYINEYFEEKSVDVFPIPSQALYTGFTMSSDNQNISESPDRPSNWDALDTMMMYTTNGLSTAYIVNQTDANTTNIHLLLSLFGIGYNTSETDRIYTLLAQMEVLKELSQVTLYAIGDSRYVRYSGILGDENVYIVPIVECWAYATSSNGDINQRMTSIRFSFQIINKNEKSLSNITFSSLIKADLYLEEANLTEDENTDNAFEDLMVFAMDDQGFYNESSNIIYLTDYSNNSRDSSEANATALGFRSNNILPDSWEVGSYFDLIGNLTTENKFSNGINYIQGDDDPSIAMHWKLADILDQKETTSLELDMCLGMANSTENATVKMNNQFQYLQENVTQEDVIDIALIEPKFNRISYKEEFYKSEVVILNIGTIKVNQTEVLFLVNRTNKASVYELYAIVQNIDNLDLWSYLKVDVEWYPIFEDLYVVAWVIITIEDSEDVSAEFPVNPEDITQEDLVNQISPFISLLGSIHITSYQSRNVVIIDRAFYQGIASDEHWLLTSPDSLPLVPFDIQFPGDFSFVNFTFYTIESIQNVEIIAEGVGGDWIAINKTHLDYLDPYSTNFILLFVPLFTSPGEYNINLVLKVGKTQLISVPITFVIHPMKGRVFFDMIHNNITLNLADITDLGSLLEEILDHPYGSFNNLKDLWGNRRPLGTAVQPLISGLSLNISDLFGGGAGNETETYFIPKTIKGLSFEGEGNLTTDYLDSRLTQFGDLLILYDPEVAYSEKDIEETLKYVNNGGVVFLWVEPSNENNWTSINELINYFGFEIDETQDEIEGEVQLVDFYFDNILAPENSLDIELTDPVKFNTINLSQNTNVTSHNLHNSGYFGVSHYGDGKICLIGDKELFNNTGLQQEENEKLANILLDWAFSNSAEIEITVDIEKIKRGENAYFDLYITNHDELDIYLDEGFIFIGSYADDDGNEIKPSDANFSINPLWETHPGHYMLSFQSDWYNGSGMIYAIFFFDHKAIPSMIIFANILILDEFLVVGQEFIFPDIPYEHLFDFLLLTWVLLMFSIQFLYRRQKWGRRFRIVNLEDEKLYEAQTYLREAEMITKSLNQTLSYSTYSEIDKIRFIMRIRKRLSKLLKQVREFSDEIGEV